MDKKVLDVSWASLWRVLFFALFAAILVSGLQIILGLFLAIVISSGLEVLVRFLEKRGVPRTLGVILVFLAGALAFMVIVYLIVPFVIADLNLLFSSQSENSPLNSIFNLKSAKSLSAVINKISTDLFSAGESPLGPLSDILGGLGLGLAVIISSFYLSLSRDGVERFIRAVLPKSEEESALRIYERSSQKIGSWFRTQILLSFIVGALVWIVLMLLGVRHAFLLGLITAIFEIVPFVGPIVSGGVAVLFALTVSPTLAFYTFLVFIAIQQFESHFLVPLVTKRAIGLHPVLVIVSLLIGLQLGGALGGVIAVPAAAVMQEIVEERSSKKTRDGDEE